MALTRVQLLQGDTSKGVVLPGQVQGVKQGTGISIAGDGTISVNASTAVGLLKLNNAFAYNNYEWPASPGPQNSFLMYNGSGALSWEFPTLLVTSVSNSGETLSNIQRIVVTSAGETYTLPSNPERDWQVAIAVGNFSDTVVNPNGKKIMGLNDVMQLDVPNSTTYFYYVNEFYGWRVSL